jgi:hypothetical protein
MTDLARRRVHARVFFFFIRGSEHVKDGKIADPEQKGTPGYR